MATIAIWAIRATLAVSFLFVGLVKFRNDEGSVWIEIFRVIGFGQWFRYFTGAVEAAGGLLLLWPRATWVAVLLLAPTMVGALLSHVFLFQVGPQSFVVLLLLAGVLFVGWHWSRQR